MAKRIISFVVLIAMVLSGSAVYARESDTITEFSHDFNDGSLKNVVREIATLGSFANQEYYIGNHITIKNKTDDGSDKYAELGPGENSTATFMLLFPETMYGKVVVEADFKSDNLTTSRNLFQVVSHDEQAVFNLICQGYYYSLAYEQTNTDIFPIPINDEWHRFRAVVDTNENNFMLYCDGVACMEKPFTMNRGANAKDGISGIKSQIVYNQKRGETEGTTGIDNIRAYTISDEEYKNFSSDELSFDYKSHTVANAVKGITVGEFLSKINLHDSDANAVVLQKGYREKADDEVMYAGDELVITQGRHREFYGIRLKENSHAQYFLHINSPEIFSGADRKQINDDDSSVTPLCMNGETYFPISLLKSLFDYDLRINRDDGTVLLSDGKTEKTLSVGAEITEINNSLFCKKSLFDELNINLNVDDNGLVMMGTGDFAITESERDYLEKSFIFKSISETADVIYADGDLKTALEKAEKLLETNDVVIELGNGTYTSDDAFVVKNNGQHRLTIRGNKDKHATVTGGIHLTADDFKSVPDSAQIKKRFPQVSADKIVMCNLKDLGIDDLGEIVPQGHTFEIKPSEVTLYADGQAQTMARYPNTGYVYTGDTLNSGFGNPSSGLSENEFRYVDTRVENWQIDDNSWMFGYWNNEYTNSQAKIRRVDKKHQSIIIDSVLRGQMTANNRPYYYFNILEELDLPGEYFIDFNTSVMYYYPTETFAANGVDLSVKKNTLVELDKAKNVVLENIDFEYCRDIAVKERNCANVLIKDCSFVGIGTYAILQTSCNASGVYGCDINQTGAHSIMLEGGNLYTLTKSDNYVINTRIRQNGTRRRTYSGAILSRGCGNYIYKNSFRDSEHMGVYLFGAQHSIEYNSFSNMCNMSGDAGCIYMAGCWYTAGTRTIANYFEDMSPHPEVHAGGNTAVYYDNSTSHSTTYGNIMNDTVMAVMSNCGRYNRIYGNTFNAMKTSAGSIGAALNASFTADYGTLRMIPYAGDIWKEQIPEISQLEYNYNPKRPIGTEVHNNIWQDTKDFSVTAPKISLEYDNISSDDTDLFVDRENKDFRISSPGNYKSVLVEGDVDYAKMGTGADFAFADNAELERAFVYTDISKADKANIFMNLGEFASLYVKARDVDGNIIDDDKLSVTVSSDDESVKVSENNVLYAVNNGKATITAKITYGNKTINTKLFVYTDKTLWDKDNMSDKDKPVRFAIDDVDTGIGELCVSEKGTLLMPAKDVLTQMGYEEIVNNNTYSYVKDNSTVTFTVDSQTFVNNGTETTMVKAAYIANDKLYVPFSIFEDLGILNIYSEAAKTANVYMVNHAEGEEKIPEGVKVQNISDMIKDADGWTSDTTADYQNDGSTISFGYDANGTKNCVLGYKAKYLDNNSLIKGECEWNSDTFISFAFRIADPEAVPWRSNDASYYFIVKPDSIEVQKRIDGKTTFIIDNVPNTYFTKGETHNISVGIVDSDDGPRAILNVDNVNVIDAVDKINYSVSGTTRIISDKLDNVTEPGYVSFTLYSTAKGASDAYFKMK